MVNHTYGPDEQPYNPQDPEDYNDDDDGVPFWESKVQHSTSVAVLGSGETMQVLTVFSDHSQMMAPYPHSTDFSVGIARPRGGGQPWYHDLARAIPPDVPPPSEWPGGWRKVQKGGSVSVGGNGRFYLMGYDFDPLTKEGGLFVARSDDGGAT